MYQQLANQYQNWVTSDFFWLLLTMQVPNVKKEILHSYWSILNLPGFPVMENFNKLCETMQGY